MKKPGRFRRTARGWRIVSLASWAVLVSGAITACRTTPNSGRSRSAAAQCDEEAPGMLRISNSSGRVLEVYAARGDARPELLRQLSPGTASIPVPGPEDIAVRYEVIDPNARQMLAAVTWLRRTSREITRGVMAELSCASKTSPDALPQP